MILNYNYERRRNGRIILLLDIISNIYLLRFDLLKTIPKVKFTLSTLFKYYKIMKYAYQIECVCVVSIIMYDVIISVSGYKEGCEMRIFIRCTWARLYKPHQSNKGKYFRKKMLISTVVYLLIT